jgi:peptide/nickel transport system substrate-binding protein
MTRLLNTFAAALISATALTAATAASVSLASAETVLRLDEVAVGELDPGKASDYADSILMFNVYDTLVIPPGRAGVIRASGRKLGPPTATPTPSSCAGTSSSRAAIR